MSKTFKTGGVSRVGGKLALRATNREGDTYAEILKKEGHTDVHLVKLKTEMTKDEILKYLPGLKHFQEPAILAFLKEAAGGEATAAKKKITKPAQEKAPKDNKKKKKPATASSKTKTTEESNDDGSEIATVVDGDGDHVDVRHELGSEAPAFAKHTE